MTCNRWPRTLANLPKLKARLTDRKPQRLAFIEAHLHLCPELRARLESALADECPLSASDGNFIREGFDEELDSLRQLARGGKEWIAAYQKQQMDQTGIQNLKVGYNKVFGYYLEVTNTHRDKIPESFIRKQTLKNCERFITPELKEYEEKVLAADDKASSREQTLVSGTSRSDVSTPLHVAGSRDRHRGARCACRAGRDRIDAWLGAARFGR